MTVSETAEGYENLWFCVECANWACNRDLSSLDLYYEGQELKEREQEIKSGLESIKGRVVADFSEYGNGIKIFNSSSCDCCGTSKSGQRLSFLILQ